MRFSRSFRGTAIAALAAATLAPVMAGATTVSPVMVDLQSAGRGVVANVSVNNTGADALPIEVAVEVLKAGITGFESTGQTSEDLLVVPPSALIPAGQVQTFRVQWVGDPALTDSKHFYVDINQIPVKLPENTSAVQVVYNFQVLTSVSSPVQKPDLTIRSAALAKTNDGKPAIAITVENAGGAHGYLSQHRIKFTQTDAAGKELFSRTFTGSEFQQLIGYGLVASHAVRTITVPLTLPTATGSVSAVLMDERAQ